MKILIAEDDPDTLELVARALERAGYGVLTATDGEHALDLLAWGSPDLVILDLVLPGVDGFEVCRRIRLNSQIPILVLTARGDDDDVMRSFRLGVDDYVTKPFGMRLLVARVATLLRRTAEGGQRQRGDHVQAGGLELDVHTLEVRKDGQQVRLTPLEFRILHILTANSGRVVPYDRLIEYAWGHDGASPAHLKIRVCSIRKKLGLPVTGEAGIKAIVGTGYALRGL